MIKLFQKRVKWRPPVGLFEPAARDAFRVLGLAAQASQAEVFDAASSLRLALKVGVGKTFEGDAAWLGEVARKESDVRDAVGRLSEPVQRARERLYWFHLPAPRAHVSTVAGLTAAVEELLKRVPVRPSDSGDEGAARLSDEEAAALHDAALLALAGLVRLDPLLREAEAWARAFRLWRRLFACEEFWSLLVAADLKGDYEQSVTFGEVAALRRAAPRVVYAHAAGRARDAVRKGELHEAARAFGLLRGAAPPALLLREYEEETVGPAEDKLTEELDAAFTLIDAAGFDVKTEAERRNHCNHTWHRFGLLRPRLADFTRLAGADSPHARRVFEHASSKLFKLAVAFEQAGRTQEALHVCLRAHALAPPESLELSDIEAKLAALGAAVEGRARGRDEYAAALAREFGDVSGAPPKLFKDDPKGGKPLESYTPQSDRAGCLTSFGFWLAMVAFCVGLQRCGVINTRSTRTPTGALPAMNIRPNLNFNVNYNLRPVNIPPPLVYPAPPAKVRPRDRRRRAPGNANAETLLPPPTVVPAAPAR